MSFIPKPHEIYKHFKGGLYQITAIAEHTETGEKLVVYQALYGEFKTYARPLQMFTEKVDRDKYPDAPQEYRFERMDTAPGGQAREEASANAGTAVAEEQSQEKASANAGTGVPEGQIQREALLDTGTAAAERQSQGNASGNTGTAAAERQSQGEASSNSGIAEHPESQTQEAEEGFALDPLVLEFLDSDTYEQKLNIMAALRHRITDDMITTMAIACDVEIEEGDTQERYEALKNCLLTLEKYESNRLR